ncbi:zf-HC2 domain-containing protein [Nocardioides sp.]|uniref:zf-HC2 domain-containing protein n=1 Tax=Nocardioides sp. TaxID=35761 RepID=UPI002B27305E|nr:zf-HC2 domain-containing protein [Nocardioides sp.]
MSALLDGQLSAEESERAWAHVHGCHQCRDLVEREGWIKTRLAGSSSTQGGAPDALKGALLGLPPGDVLRALSAQRHEQPAPTRARRAAGLAAIGGGAAGAAVMGVLALGAAPADVSNNDRRLPASQMTPASVPAKAPSRELSTP